MISSIILGLGHIAITVTAMRSRGSSDDRHWRALILRRDSETDSSEPTRPEVGFGVKFGAAGLRERTALTSGFETVGPISWYVWSAIEWLAPRPWERRILRT